MTHNPERHEPERGNALDRLWDVTRPAAPAEAVWDAVWDRVSQRLDAGAGPATLPMPRRGHRGAVFALVGLAQAAAVVAALTVGLAGRPHAVAPDSGSGPRVASAPSSAAAIEIEAGDVTMIRADGPRVRAVVRARDAPANAFSGLDENFAMLNALEAMAD